MKVSIQTHLTIWFLLSLFSSNLAAPARLLSESSYDDEGWHSVNAQFFSLPKPIFVFENKYGLDPATDKDRVEVLVSNYRNGSDSQNVQVLSLKKVPNKKFLEIAIDENLTINRQFLMVRIKVSEAPNTQVAQLSTEEPIYTYKNTEVDKYMGIGLIFSIAYMILSCGCWIFGVKQFYHLVRISQQFYVPLLLNSAPLMTRTYGFLHHFSKNIFSVIGPKLTISEEDFDNSCRPPLVFWAQSLSCLSLNSLNPYLLSFALYLLLYFLASTNKCIDRAFFYNLAQTFDTKTLLLSIGAVVITGTGIAFGADVREARGEGGIYSLGLLLAVGVVFLYVWVFWSMFGLYYEFDRRLVAFLQHHVFERSTLTLVNPKISKKFWAVYIEGLKLIFIALTASLFYHSPKVQLFLITGFYACNFLFLLFTRPSSNSCVNYITIITELLFLIFYIIRLDLQMDFWGVDVSRKEEIISSAEIGLFATIYFLNLIVFLIPILYGEDTGVVPVAQNSGTQSKAKKNGILESSHSLTNGESKFGNNKDSLGKLKLNYPERDIQTADRPKSKPS